MATTKKNKEYRGTKCLNCKTPLDVSDRYCHYCGQLNSTKKLTLRDFFEEFLANFYAYDSKLKNSLVSMFTKPGVLAKEYNAGMRQKYANPFRLFLSACIVLFLTESFYEKTTVDENKTEKTEKKDATKLISLSEDGIKISDINEEKKYFFKDSIYTAEELEMSEDENYNFNNIGHQIRTFKNYHLKYPSHSTEKALEKLGFKTTTINKILYEKTKNFRTNDVIYEMQNYFMQKLPFLIFLSLPFLSLIFLIAYPSRSINYTEHLVFSYSYFTFLISCWILFTLIDLLHTTSANYISGLFFYFGFPYYFYRSLRNFYGQSRWKTIFKFIILNPLFLIFFITSLFLIFAVGLLLF